MCAEWLNAHVILTIDKNIKNWNFFNIIDDITIKGYIFKYVNVYFLIFWCYFLYYIYFSSFFQENMLFLQIRNYLGLIFLANNISCKYFLQIFLPKYFLHLALLLNEPILIKSKWNDETDLCMYIISYHYN